MSNYTLAVNWSGKDALADSDVAKVISGSDFNTEFTTVQTAVNSKADLNGDATEDFSCTTQGTSENSTKVATTAYVTTAVANNHAFPVGAIFTTTVAYANSAAVVTAIGGTTWVAFGAGKVLVGLDSGDTDFDTSEETGGSKAPTSGSTAADLEAHTHTFGYTATPSSGSANTQVHPRSAAAGDNPAYNEMGTKTTSSTGSGGGHTHTGDAVQPYIVVYFWKRTA